MQNEMMANNLEPSPYVHINHNIYLVKKKLNDIDDSMGCFDCDSGVCYEQCLCRSQRISCSSVCGCSDILCTNRPFQNEKKVNVVMTRRCGWGVEAAEFIGRGEFIMEYVGEVINDTLRDERLWRLEEKGATSFYMCEVQKDYIIDATFKGNISRFMNHNCDPNCVLEKWVINKETRLGVFATKSIEPGEPLTYDYRFVQFGQEVECRCDASTCRGYLSTKKKRPNVKDKMLAVEIIDLES